jgi:D-galactonate transporter
MNSQVSPSTEKKTNVRWLIVVILFIITAINYGDRATISIAGSPMSKELGMDSVDMGYIFSAFGWAYVIFQIPGGWLLDRFGSKKIYFCSIFSWSLFTLLQGTVWMFSAGWAFMALFCLRFCVGVAESPSFPGNSRIAAAWFPAQERATAVSIFNSAQYFATVIFAPIMGWLTHHFGWHYVFIFMGGIGIVGSIVWLYFIHDPKDHPHANKAEIDYITAGGALVSMDQKKPGAANQGPKLSYIKQLVQSRMLMGVCLAQYCINALTFFFISWFPVYLVQERGLDILKAGIYAAIPAVCGFIGGLLGGVLSDFIMRKSKSLSIARKTPIVMGMLLSMVILACNYTDSTVLVVFFMAISFFGKGLGALGWAVLADSAPKEISGLTGGVFNMCGNVSSIVTPIAIGYIIKSTGSFKMALVFVAVHAAVAVISYLFIVGKIQRLELKKDVEPAQAQPVAQES